MTTIPDALLARGYQHAARSEPTFADSLSLTVGPGRVHVALRADGSTAVYALDYGHGRPRSPALFGASSPAGDVIAAVDAAEEELRQAADKQQATGAMR